MGPPPTKLTYDLYRSHRFHLKYLVPMALRNRYTRGLGAGEAVPWFGFEIDKRVRTSVSQYVTRTRGWMNAAPVREVPNPTSPNVYLDSLVCLRHEI